MRRDRLVSIVKKMTMSRNVEGKLDHEDHDHDADDDAGHYILVMTDSRYSY